MAHRHTGKMHIDIKENSDFKNICGQNTHRNKQITLRTIYIYITFIFIFIFDFRIMILLLNIVDVSIQKTPLINFET